MFSPAGFRDVWFPSFLPHCINISFSMHSLSTIKLMDTGQKDPTRNSYRDLHTAGAANSVVVSYPTTLLNWHCTLPFKICPISEFKFNILLMICFAALAIYAHLFHNQLNNEVSQSVWRGTWNIFFFLFNVKSDTTSSFDLQINQGQRRSPSTELSPKTVRHQGATLQFYPLKRKRENKTDVSQFL